MGNSTVSPQIPMFSGRQPRNEQNPEQLTTFCWYMDNYEESMCLIDLVVNPDTGMNQRMEET